MAIRRKPDLFPEMVAAIAEWEAARNRLYAKIEMNQMYGKWGEAMSDNTIKFTREQVADLRALVSIAVWIRSEQIAQRDVNRLLNTIDPVAWRNAPMPPTLIDTRNLVLENVMADHAAAIAWWTRLDAMLKVMGGVEIEPSWRRKHEEAKNPGD